MKLVKILLISLLSISLFAPTFADEEIYVVKDTNSNFSETYNSYYAAYSSYLNNLDSYNNLILIYNNKIIEMEYGIVEFVGEDGLLQYYSTIRNEKDYLHSSYGIDGAFLYTDSGKVYFAISGDKGYTDIENVNLIPYEYLTVSPSIYETKDGYLYHNIKTQLDFEYFSNSLCLDFAPEFLENNSIYYSYDGHYFYSDFYTMIDDYNNEAHDNSLNDKPYYNYYEYLPHRSISNYSLKELEEYFYEVLCIDGKMIDYNDINGDGAAEQVNKSQIYGELDEFYNAQSIYGTNEMMLISSAIVESNYGKSLNAYLTNNLYANAAYETTQEKNNGRYNRVANSIYSHAKYFISSMYSNHLKNIYNGTYFGNKTGGINIEYSLDTYYGEKAASQYFKLDNSLGLKDYNSLSIGIIKDIDVLNVYKDNDLSDVLYSLKNVNELSLVVLEEGEDYYKIQIDDSFSADYIYDFKDNIGYIKKEDITYLFNEKSIHEYDLNKINYNFNGGNYYGFEELSVKTLNGLTDPSIEPNLDGYEFIGYSVETNNNDSIVYEANYKKISEISIDYLLEKQKELLPYPDLSHGKLNVVYADGTSKKIDITSDMISSYDNKDFDVQTIYITYCGLSLEKQIQIDGDYYLVYADLNQAIKSGNSEYVKENVDDVKYPYTMSEIRKLDNALKIENNRNYVIKDNSKSYDISISGLDLSLDDRRNFNLIEDTYYVNIKNIDIRNSEKLNKIANGYGFDIETGINISFKFNYQNIDLRGPAIIQLDLKNKTTDKIYSVYHIDTKGNVIKCRTTQSDNYIQFMIGEKGDYLVISMPSNNEYHIDDTIESLNYENMGFDNNRINIEFMVGLVLIVLSLIGILIYYRIEENKDKQWKDYKKLLQKVDIVQEEKPNN